MKKIKWILKTKYWLVRKLIGNMPVIANIKISDHDFNSNIDRFSELPHMFFNNVVYDLNKLIERKVYTGNSGEVRRVGNSFTLVR